MSSKQLDSILKTVPAATVELEKQESLNVLKSNRSIEETDRIVASNTVLLLRLLHDATKFWYPWIRNFVSWAAYLNNLIMCKKNKKHEPQNPKTPECFYEEVWS